MNTVSKSVDSLADTASRVVRAAEPLVIAGLTVFGVEWSLHNIAGPHLNIAAAVAVALVGIALGDRANDDDEVVTS